MKRAHAVLEVTRWEILRYFKLKQQIVGFLMTFGILLGISFMGRLGAQPDTVDVAVINAEALPTLPDATSRFVFRRHDAAAADSLRAAVDARDLAALLLLRSDGAGELVTRQSPGWRGELAQELSVAAQLNRIRESGVSADVLAAIQAPFELSVVESAPRAGSAERLAAMVALGLMLVGLFSGIGYIFSSVTGEKNNRLSEQVVSAIPAQSWIDGKIVGLSIVSIAMIVNTVLAIALWMAARHALWGDAVTMPSAVQRPELLAVALALILLGYFFWFTFLIAVAALVDDPHTSTRSQLLFLPVLAATPAFLAIPDPHATWVRILSVLPPTSAAVMPARILVAEVAALEIAAAALLLVGIILGTRRIAGKVFRLGMLMYGKEPTWHEVRRWLREA